MQFSHLTHTLSDFKGGKMQFRDGILAFDIFHFFFFYFTQVLRIINKNNNKVGIEITLNSLRTISSSSSPR